MFARGVYIPTVYIYPHACVLAHSVQALQNIASVLKAPLPLITDNSSTRFFRKDHGMKKLPIVIDTREQLPLDFSPWGDSVSITRATLWPGDYSIRGATHLIAIERKSVTDLIGTMMSGYAGYGATTPKRFDAELMALRGLALSGARAMILVEPDGLAQNIGNDAEEQIKAHHYRSMITPDKVLAFVQSLRENWRVPVVFAASRHHAAEIAYHALLAAETLRRTAKAVDADIVSAIEGARSAPRVSDDKSTTQSAPSDSRGV